MILSLLAAACSTQKIHKKHFIFVSQAYYFTLIHKESDSQKLDDFSDMLIADLELEFRTSEYLSAQT